MKTKLVALFAALALVALIPAAAQAVAPTLTLGKAKLNKTKGTATVDLFYWLVTDGQQYASNLHYANLPGNMVSYDIAVLKDVMSGGATLLNVPLSQEWARGLPSG